MKNELRAMGMLAASLGLACSEDGAGERDRAMLSPAGAAGSVGDPIAAAGAAGAGAGGAAASPPVLRDLRLGDALEFIPGTGEVPYAIGPNPYGIRGGGFLARSRLGNTIRVGTLPGEICISGNLDEVPNGDYGNYWGVEIGFNLNQGAVDESGAPAGPGAPSAPAPGADAGSTDAGSTQGHRIKSWIISIS